MFARVHCVCVFFVFLVFFYVCMCVNVYMCEQTGTDGTEGSARPASESLGSLPAAVELSAGASPVDADADADDAAVAAAAAAVTTTTETTAAAEPEEEYEEYEEEESESDEDGVPHYVQKESEVSFEKLLPPFAHHAVCKYFCVPCAEGKETCVGFWVCRVAWAVVFVFW